MSSRYFGKIESIISYITESKLVDAKNKENYLFTLFIDMNDDESICTLAYLSFCLYQEREDAIFSYNAMRKLIIKCDNLCGHVCENNNDKIACLKLHIESDFGYYNSDRKEEPYTQTLNRVIYNKAYSHEKNLD